MKWWLWALGVVAVAAVAAGVTVGVVRAEPDIVLAPGQSYVFTTGDPTLVGEVLAPPRGDWVQVRLLNNSGTPAKTTWVNLRLVKAISLVDPQDVTR